MILFNILSHFVLVTLHIAEQKVLCGAFLTVAKTVQTLQSRGVLNHRKTPTGFILCYCLLTAAAILGSFYYIVNVYMQQACTQFNE